MCGIAGAIDFDRRPKIEECLSRMLESMKRRGPDASGIDISSSGILFHTRLIVIDPVNGGQPMKLTHEGETYTLIYNGELYNTEEIRAELIQCGEAFTGHSDTEVVLTAYAHWGAECLQKFNGIYAFAVLHENEHKLFLARDRMGVKPLFYTQKDSTLIFASEIKTLLCYPGVNAVLDAEGAAEILLIGPGRTPGCGVFKDIHELRPGEYAEFSEGRLRRTRYWKLLDRKHEASLEETVEKVRYLVCDSIERQLVSDVPIGTFLSGGLDSSIISSVASDIMKKQGERLKTFSVTYRDNSKYFRSSRFQPASDDDFIGIMVKYLDSDHHNVIIDNESLARALFTAVDARDMPGMADIDSSLVLFCEEIKKHVTVALSGECADEIFGGYPWYRDKKIRAVRGFPWAQSTEMRAAFISDRAARSIAELQYYSDNKSASYNEQIPAVFSDSELHDIIKKRALSEISARYEKTISETDIIPGLSPEETRLREMVRLNTDWFMTTLLDRKDRMSMYNGLEVRVPFCDHRIAEYMYSVPWEMKDLGGIEKGLLREAVRGLLPEEIRLRRKSPYPKTHNPGYRSIVESMLSDILKTNDAPIYSLVSRSALSSLIDNEFIEPWYGQLMTGPQTVAYMLQLNYWLEKYNVRISI